MAYCGPRGIALSSFLKWDQHDQDAALEWQSHENRRCRQCGHHPDEHADGVHAHIDVCPGCEARAKVQRADTAKDDGATALVADGTRAACPRCVAEHQANQAHPPIPDRRRRT